MSKVWAVASHTISAGIRMRVAVFFVFLIALVVFGIPFVLRGDGSLAGAIQSYLMYSLLVTSLLLSLMTIMMSWTMSEELVQQQILILMAKPVARWQYVFGKWLGIVTLDAVLLAGAGGGVYGMTRYMASLPEWVEGDHFRIGSEVLSARHVSHVDVPDFGGLAARRYEQRKEEGYYSARGTLSPSEERAEKDRLGQEEELRWRTVLPLEGAQFEFRNVLCERAPDKYLQLRFDATIYNPPPNDVISCRWWFGDRKDGVAEYGPIARRYVRGRIHTVPVPTDAVDQDGTLIVRFQNIDPYGENERTSCIFSFQGHKTFEVLFGVGTFGGNLVRLLVLVFCRLMFLAAVAILATSLFSFPIACVATVVFYVFVALRSFIMDAFDYMSDETFIDQVFRGVGWLLRVFYMFVPDWQKYNALELLADGRNVTLVWVLTGFGKLGLSALVLVGVACLLFERREVAEVSV